MDQMVGVQQQLAVAAGKAADKFHLGPLIDQLGTATTLTTCAAARNHSSEPPSVGSHTGAPNANAKGTVRHGALGSDFRWEVARPRA